MATQPTQATLVDLRLFSADLNIRRSLSAFSLNYSAEGGGISSNQFTLDGQASPKVFVAPNPCSITLIRTNSPIDVTITPRTGDPYTLKVSKCLLLDADLAQLSIVNPAAAGTVASVYIVQG